MSTDTNTNPSREDVIARTKEKLSSRVFQIIPCVVNHDNPLKLEKSCRGCDVGTSQPIYRKLYKVFAQEEGKIYFDFQEEHKGVCKKAFLTDGKQVLTHFNSDLDLVKFITSSFYPTDICVSKFNVDFQIIFENEEE